MPSAAPTDEKVIVVDKARVKRVASIKTLEQVDGLDYKAVIATGRT